MRRPCGGPRRRAARSRRNAGAWRGISSAGTINQVLIAGPVYNYGGEVQIGSGDVLHIAGMDANGRSYWQQQAATAQLSVNQGNINALGTYQIDIGTMQLMAVSGATTDELDGAGLLFGNTNQTALTILDSTPGTPGMITIQGPVTLAANTTTTENFSGHTNTADVIDVQNGTLTVNGTLKLISADNRKPTQPLTFLDDRGTNPVIAGNFTTVTVNIQPANLFEAIAPGIGVDYYQVTIT